MSLLAQAMEDCIYIDKTTAPDDYGGIITVWKEGAPFQAAIVYDTSLEARKAEKEGVTNVFTITTPRKINLMYGEIIKRISDGKLFRITSDGTDKKSPLSSTLDMRVVSAEELEQLPS